jgi:uncharacterized protein YceK
MRMLWLAALVVLGSCATMQKDQTVCPEFRNIRCAGRTVCDMDQGRGCRVCKCEDATNLAPDPGPPENPSLPGN